MAADHPDAYIQLRDFNDSPAAEVEAETEVEAEAEVQAEEWITDRLEALQAKMVDDDGIEYYTHPSAASSSGSGGGGPSGGRYGGYGLGARGFGAYSDDDDAYMYDDGYR